MSKEFSRVSIDRLCSWILKEYDETEQIFGIHKDLFFTPQKSDRFTMTRYGQFLESPIGVAAGPHTQMAQNIIVAWLCGSRYLELKTVQTLDELNVSKPCIDMQDEGFNCEWSQELKLQESFDEYLNAWIMIYVLRHKFGWSNDNGCGFIFNMSVGYNLEGILKSNVQQFLDKMENCETELKEKIAIVKKYYPDVDKIDIPSKLSDNTTLSTMHGCPPDEIEKIAMYLVKERKYHTTIKLNPTLLGAKQLRHILNDKLGFESHIPDEAFAHDLKYPDGVKIIHNMLKASAEENLDFALKLTNTLESTNHKDIFPANEKMMYLSGRALHPISTNVVAKLQNEFDGSLDVSFSAGADCFNLPKLIASGVKPVTVSSDLLKPGGYGRLSQYLDNLNSAMKEENANNIDEYILNFSGVKDVKVKKAALINLRRYAGAVVNNKAYKRDSKMGESVKTDRKLTVFDCVRAPCIDTCPTNQDIPSYMYHTANGNYKEAYKVIMKNNPLPNILGMVCDHPCQYKCTRTNFDNPLLIRDIKRFIAAKSEFRPEIKPDKANGKKVAIIGAGPSGLSCGYFLAMKGFGVSIYETKAFAGGMVSDAIPAFRLTADAIHKDVQFIQSLGVAINYDYKIDKNEFAKLRKANDYVYIAIGAQEAKNMNIKGEDAEGVMNQLQFLSDVRQEKITEIGPNVAIIGGGNSAMDAARTAQRLIGEGGKVTIVYRRTKAQMPAESEEIRSVIEEGIEVLELHQPLEIIVKDGKVAGMKCQQMKLGDKGKDGRRSPVAIDGAIVELEFDNIIRAIGQNITPDFVKQEDLKVDPGTGMSQIKNVFAGGDAVRGASTIVHAVGDGSRVAKNIIATANKELDLDPAKFTKGMSPEAFQYKNARREKGMKLPEIDLGKRHGFATVIRELTEAEAQQEASRCLYCNDSCNVCVTVCPNRANRSYAITPADYIIQKAVLKKGKMKIENVETLRISQDTQIINIGDFCNECGNCTMFCPTSGDPYKDKPKFYLTEESFKPEDNGFHLNGKILKAHFDTKKHELEEKEDALHYTSGKIHARLNKETLQVIEVETQGEKPKSFSFDKALRMGILYNALKGSCFSE